MSRWSQQLENHPVRTTAESVKEHLSIEVEDVSGELFSERQRLDQFINRLFETLDALDPEQTPLNRLDSLNNHLIKDVTSNTRNYSISGDVQYLRTANDNLQNALFEICVLQLSMTPFRKQEIVEPLNQLVDEFDLETESKRKKVELQSIEIKKTLGQQEQRLDELINQVEAKDAELNALISDWQNQFNEAQRVRQTEHNTAHKQRETEFSNLLKATEQEAKNTTDKLISEQGLELNNTKGDSDEFIDLIKNELNDILVEGKKKREEILELHQFVVKEGTTTSYGQNANHERNQANTWRRICLTFIIFAAFFQFSYISLSTLVVGMPSLWTIYLGVVSLTGIMLFGAGYGAQQSTRHRNSENRNRGLALKINALEPFIRSFTDQKKGRLKKMMREQLFLSNGPAEYSDDTSFNVLNRFAKIYEKFQKAHKH